jgi:hypothetical protein
MMAHQWMTSFPIFIIEVLHTSLIIHYQPIGLKPADGYQKYRMSTAFLLGLMTLVLRTKSILIYR